MESPGLFSVARGKGYSSEGAGEGSNRVRDACGIKTDVLQFACRSVGLCSSKSQQVEGFVRF